MSYTNYYNFTKTFMSDSTSTEEVIRPSKNIETTESTAIIPNEVTTSVVDTSRNNSTKQEIVRQFSDTLDDSGVTDELQAQVLHQIMTKADKTIVSKDEWVLEVPDWSARLWALKLSLQAKWHLTPKEDKKSWLDDKIFVFMQ